MLPERLRGEHHADEDQEGERQDLHRRVALDEVADRACEDHHHAHRQDHRRHHDRQVLRHPDGGYDRVEREDDVEQPDLDDDRPEGGGAHRLRLGGVLDLELVVDLDRRLPDEEEATGEQDEVAPGDAVAHHREQVAGQPHHPADGEEEPEPRHEGDDEPQLAGLRLLLPREAAGEDGEEDDVVDAQDDLHEGERRERDPGLGGAEQFEHGGQFLPIAARLSSVRTSPTGAPRSARARRRRAGPAPPSPPSPRGWQQYVFFFFFFFFVIYSSYLGGVFSNSLNKERDATTCCSSRVTGSLSSGNRAVRLWGRCFYSPTWP